MARVVTQAVVSVDGCIAYPMTRSGRYSTGTATVNCQAARSSADCLQQAGKARQTSRREDPLACLRCAGWPLARAGHADGGRFPATRANSLSRVA